MSTWLSGHIVILIDGVLSAELLGQEVDSGGSLLGLWREELFAEGGDGVDDSAVVWPVGGFVNVTFG
jgi:hypothetical protein